MNGFRHDRDGYVTHTIGELKTYLSGYKDDDLVVQFYSPEGERLTWDCDAIAEGNDGPFVLVDLE